MQCALSFNLQNGRKHLRGRRTTLWQFGKHGINGVRQWLCVLDPFAFQHVGERNSALMDVGGNEASTALREDRKLTTGGKLLEYQSDAVDIGRDRKFTARRLLRRHIPRRTHHKPWRRTKGLGQLPEV